MNLSSAVLLDAFLAAPWAAVVAVFLLAGAVKGLVGLGLPTVSMGLLTLVMPPAAAAAWLLVPSLVTNVWQFAGGPTPGAVLRRFLPMMLGIVAGTLAGVVPDLGSASPLAQPALGVVLVVYGAYGLWSLQASRRRGRTAGASARAGEGADAAAATAARRRERWLWSPLVGTATGIVSAASGVFVVPAVPYLQSLGLKRDELVQALGLAFTVSTLALGTQLARTASLGATELLLSIAALVPALAGMALGGRLRRAIGERAFRVCLFAGLAALGLHMIGRGLG